MGTAPSPAAATASAPFPSAGSYGLFNRAPVPAYSQFSTSPLVSPQFGAVGVGKSCNSGLQNCPSISQLFSLALGSQDDVIGACHEGTQSSCMLSKGSGSLCGSWTMLGMLQEPHFPPLYLLHTQKVSGMAVKPGVILTTTVSTSRDTVQGILRNQECCCPQCSSVPAVPLHTGRSVPSFRSDTSTASTQSQSSANGSTLPSDSRSLGTLVTEGKKTRKTKRGLKRNHWSVLTAHYNLWHWNSPFCEESFENEWFNNLWRFLCRNTMTIWLQISPSAKDITHSNSKYDSLTLWMLDIDLARIKYVFSSNGLNCL